MELQPKTTACLIYFWEPITTHILVQDAEEWAFTAKKDLIVRSHHGTYAITTVSKINNANEIVEKLFCNGNTHFLEMSGGDVNPTELSGTQ